MQCFLANEQLTDLLVSPKYAKTIDDSHFGLRIRSLHEQFTETNKSFINPRKTVLQVVNRMPRFSIGSEEDAHEFMIELIEHLHTETKVCSQPLVHDGKVEDSSPSFQKSFKHNNKRVSPFSEEEKGQYSEADVEDDWIINKSDKYWTKFLKTERSVATEVYYGIQEVKIQCLECDDTLVSVEPFK